MRKIILMGVGLLMMTGLSFANRDQPREATGHMHCFGTTCGVVWCHVFETEVSDVESVIIYEFIEDTMCD